MPTYTVRIEANSPEEAAHELVKAVSEVYDPEEDPGVSFELQRGRSSLPYRPVANP
jgi:hypothetical protein